MMNSRLKDSMHGHMERIDEATTLIKKYHYDADIRVEQLQIIESASHSIKKILKEEQELESIIHPTTKHLQ